MVLNEDIISTLLKQESWALTKEYVSLKFAKENGVLPIAKRDDKLIIVHRKNPVVQALLELQRVSQSQLDLVAIDETKFNSLLVKAFENEKLESITIDNSVEATGIEQLYEQSSEVLDSDDDAPIIRLLNTLFSQAINRHASDIHLETYENNMLIRFRIDGVLREIFQPPREVAPLLISRVKVLAKLDIAEKRLPQDGRIKLSLGGHFVDIRVSTLPSNHGERVVLRILDKNTARLNVQDLGMNKQHYNLMQDLIYKPHGIILVTGPTGSGKTTTLYAALSELNDSKRNILTVEDPVEYDLPGISQTAVNPKIDMTFAKGLRSILRQDPDIVMVGEIRDYETAQIAVQASLTGHLVFSTLHTNTAIGAITRLKDIGVEPYLIASSLIAVIAQRLVRVTCNQCHGEQNECEQCDGSGYFGRSGIYEVIAIDDKLQSMIHDNSTEHDMLKYSASRYPNIKQDGLEKVANGLTTKEEVLRVIG